MFVARVIRETGHKEKNEGYARISPSTTFDNTPKEGNIVFERVLQLLTAPRSEDSEQNCLAGLLHIASLTMVVLGILTSATAAFFHHFEAASALCILILGAIGSFLLTRRHLRAATVLLLIVLLGVLDFLVYNADGIHDIAVITYPVLIVVSGLLLGRRSSVAYILLIVLSAFVLVLGEVNGFIVNRFSEFTSLADMIYLLIILFSMVALSRLISNSIARNVDRVRSAQIALDKNNSELQRVNGDLSREIAERVRVEVEREKLIAQLQETLNKVKTLRGLLPICASCKKIRDDQGYWHQVEVYIRDHSEADFSHSICPVCVKKLYPELCQDDEQ